MILSMSEAGIIDISKKVSENIDVCENVNRKIDTSKKVKVSENVVGNTDDSKLDIFEIERFAIHDGPGIRTTVFLQGCPLRCQWCANPESQTVGRHILRFENKCTDCGRCVAFCENNALTIADGKVAANIEKCISCGKCVDECLNEAIKESGRKITCEELFSLIMRDKDYYDTSGGGITLSGGEALLQIDKLGPFLKKCKQNHIHIAVETCGYISEEIVEKAEKYVDLFLFDVKTLDHDKFQKFTGGNLQRIITAFTRICNSYSEKLIARVPVIPEFNDNEIKDIMKFVAKHHVKTIHLLPYHTLGMAKYKQLGREYPYHVTESMAPDELNPYIEIGEKMGLSVKIGG